MNIRTANNAFDIPIKVKVRNVMTDPATIVTKLTLPNDTTATRYWPTPAHLQLVKVATGDFLLVEACTAAGEYTLEITGTVTIAAGTFAFSMPPLKFTLHPATP